jgi:hypothetical protein
MISDNNPSNWPDLPGREGRAPTYLIHYDLGPIIANPEDDVFVLNTIDFPLEESIFC